MIFSNFPIISIGLILVLLYRLFHLQHHRWTGNMEDSMLLLGRDVHCRLEVHWRCGSGECVLPMLRTLARQAGNRAAAWRKGSRRVPASPHMWMAADMAWSSPLTCTFQDHWSHAWRLASCAIFNKMPHPKPFLILLVLEYHVDDGNVILGDVCLLACRIPWCKAWDVQASLASLRKPTPKKGNP